MMATEMLKSGDNGPRIATLQIVLNGHKPTQLAPLAVDGIFGPRTQARVKEFQTQRQLQSDGIVGKLTMGKLAGHGTSTYDSECGNGEAGNAGVKSELRRTLTTITANNSFGINQSKTTAPTGANANVTLLAALSSKFKPLSQGQVDFAKGIFLDSIDLSLVALADFKGMQNRPFTFTITPELGTLFKFLGPLSFICAGFTPSDEKLTHELTHVWQSQHHSDRAKYMANAIACQALARSANEMLVPRGGVPPAEWVAKKFPNSFPNSAYAYKLRRAFGDYNSEQIAQQAQNGEAQILAHIRSVARNAVDPDNVTSLTRLRIENRLEKDVKYARNDPVR